MINITDVVIVIIIIFLIYLSFFLMILLSLIVWVAKELSFLEFWDDMHYFEYVDFYTLIFVDFYF